MCINKGSVSSRSGIAIFIILLISCSETTFTSTEAYDARDPNGNVTIKWDVVNWTADGYVGVVTLYNYQKYHGIDAPGWTLGWRWTKKEVIWSILGSRTIGQKGDYCRPRFKGNIIPYNCKTQPQVVDLLPGIVPKIQDCCKGGVLRSWAHHKNPALSSFQITVGSAGTTNKTVHLPTNFTLKAPNPPGYRYVCGPTKVVRPTRFISEDRRRITQAFMTWNAVCKYSKFVARKLGVF